MRQDFYKRLAQENAAQAERDMVARMAVKKFYDEYLEVRRQDAKEFAESMREEPTFEKLCGKLCEFGYKDAVDIYLAQRSK